MSAGPTSSSLADPAPGKPAYLSDLLYSAANWEGSPWEYRTEPLLIPLNVADLVDDRQLHPGLVTLDDAIETIDRRYVGVDETEATLEAWTVEVEALSDRYEAEYQSYAERFAVAARLFGRALTPPLEVRVIADTSPSPRWWDDTRVTNPRCERSRPARRRHLATRPRHRCAAQHRCSRRRRTHLVNNVLNDRESR